MERYQRQTIINNWGENGQRKLAGLTISIIGLGGLGSPLAIYLAYLGIGNLLLIDGDTVSTGNLNRQILYNEDDVGKMKAEVTAKRLQMINKNISVKIIDKYIDENNINDYLKNSDGVVDALDNMQSRFIVNRYTVENKIPFFHGAIHGFEGRVTTFIPDGPCLACLYKNPQDNKKPIPAIGAVAGTIASIQVQEVIKYFLNIGELLVGEMKIWDGLKNKFFEIKYEKNSNCTVCGGSK